jgi:hypothetical protein
VERRHRRQPGTVVRAPAMRYSSASALPLDDDAVCGNSGSATTRSTPAAISLSSALAIDGLP